MVVLDYVTQPADFPTMQAHGVVGAVVYTAPAQWGWSKCITRPVKEQAESVKFQLAYNFEQNIADYLGGGTKGLEHGQAIEQACRDLALPGDHPHYLSIDTYVPPGNYPLAQSYFRSAQSQTSHPLDFYGQGDLGEYLVSLGLVRRVWQSNSSSFPGNQAPTAHTVLRQHFNHFVQGLGGSYDVNDVIQADWGSATVSPAPAPAPAPVVKRRTKLLVFYRVTDNPAVDHNAIWMTDGFTTHHLSPDQFKVNGFLAIQQGVVGATVDPAKVGSIPYGVHIGYKVQ